MWYMAVVALTSSNHRNARRYIGALGDHAEPRLLIPGNGAPVSSPVLDGAGGLLLCGGPDIHPNHYGEPPDPEAGLEVNDALDTLEFRVLREALDRDMPVLAICRGMQVLNVAFGGKLRQDVPGHRAEHSDGRWESAKHQIYLAPGSKLAAILGQGGFFRVNSRHHQGLKEAQKSPGLLASAYSLDDGLIEGLESPQHSWVVGVQCHPERQDEVPQNFQNLFLGLAERAEMYLG